MVGRPREFGGLDCLHGAVRAPLDDDVFSPEPVDVEVTLDRLDRPPVRVTAAGQATPHGSGKVLEPGVPPAMRANVL